jgi:hypothetical protein
MARVSYFFLTVVLQCMYIVRVVYRSIALWSGGVGRGVGQSDDGCGREEFDH